VLSLIGVAPCVLLVEVLVVLITCLP
jgi:hypothetical protein